MLTPSQKLRVTAEVRLGGLSVITVSGVSQAHSQEPKFTNQLLALSIILAMRQQEVKYNSPLNNENTYSSPFLSFSSPLLLLLTPLTPQNGQVFAVLDV
jgi:hypothetical protein